MLVVAGWAVAASAEELVSYKLDAPARRRAG
jgi:hypothetical protein